jgi:putative ABC transport system permease protein
LTGKTLNFGYFLSLPVLAGVLGVTLLTGLLAGSYPAVILSGFRPANVLKGSRGSIAGGSAFRKVLVVFQFALSTILIIGTMVIYSQVRYMKNKDLGFDKERLLSVSLDGGLLANVEAFKTELLRHPGIQSASATTHSPTGIFSNATGWDWPGRNPNLDPLVTLFGVDQDFEKTFGMELIQGETFRKSSGDVSEVLINQCFAKMIGRPDVVGTLVSEGDTKLRVLGVVKDFHFMSVRREIEPLILYFDSTHKAVESYRYLFIRLNPGNVSADLAFIEKTALRFNPGFPFAYSFFDDDFNQLFRSVEQEMSIVRIFAFLAILISALGLFGLAAFMAEQRTREIGIRKVLGATVPGLVSLLSYEYMKWVLLADVIALPISYFFMKNWLKSYAYKIPLGPLIFIGSAVLTFALAQMTVGFQAFKAARANPADAFRCE